MACFIILHDFFPHPLSLFFFQHKLESKSSSNFFNEIILHLLARTQHVRAEMGKAVMCHQRTFLTMIITGVLRDNFCMLLNILVISFLFLLLCLYGSIKVVLSKLCTSFLNDVYMLLYALEGLLCFTGKEEVSLGNGLDMRIQLGA
ncbi:unnamed protein product [Linum trigynum]|uniref:Uncharacterized protein n=1 Tax=Linum trigynum TaxID=586398 RepID=A0AAV2E5S4_9ROSI